MLRFYIKQMQLVNRRNLLYFPSSFNFCSSVDQNNSEIKEKEEIKDETIQTSDGNVNNYLNLGNANTVFVQKACNAITNMGHLKREKKIDKTDYFDDERFKRLIKTMETNHVTKVETMSIVSSLKALKELEIDDESFVVQNLENSLIWNTRACPIKELVMMMSFCINRRKTEGQNKLFNEVCKSLERRWVEIKGSSPLIVRAPSDNFWVLLNKNHFNAIAESSKNMSTPILLSDVKDGKVFASLLYYNDQFSPQFLSKLEDRMIEVVEDLSPGDIVLILNQLAKKKRRNIPLLKSTFFYICKHKNMLDVKQLSDCLFSMNALSFKDVNTAEQLCNELSSHIENVESSPILRSVLTSLGQLKYLHMPLLDKILLWFSTCIDGKHETRTISTKDMTSLVITLATLNFSPDQTSHTSVLDYVAKELGDATNSLPEHVLLDVVWSLTVLGKVKNDQLEAVLNPTFYNVILYHNNNKQIGSTLKLQSINSAAKLLHPDYKGPHLNMADDALLRNIKIPLGNAKLKYNQSVLEAYSSICPAPRMSNLNVNTLHGFVAEADCVLDSECRPIPIAEYGNNFGNSEPSKELPSGGQRLALLTATFQDCLLGGELSGLMSFNVRLLESLGYKVLIIKYTDWPAAENLVSRVRLLDERIKKLKLPEKTD